MNKNEKHRIRNFTTFYDKFQNNEKLFSIDKKIKFDIIGIAYNLLSFYKRYKLKKLDKLLISNKINYQEYLDRLVKL